MLPAHIALVSEAARLSPGELSEVASAIQKQVTRDFGPLWGIAADVSAFSALECVPLDYWPIIIRDDIGTDAAGVQEDSLGQPYALVRPDKGWTLAASHEALEMIADPFGKRLVAGDSVSPGQGRVQYLVEICDPVEAPEFAYTVNGVTVSDFYTPHFFDPVSCRSVRYSFTDALDGPRRVAKGGHLSWYDPVSRDWWQRTWFGDRPIDSPLPGVEGRHCHLRSVIDRKTSHFRRAAGVGLTPINAPAGCEPASKHRATLLRRAMRSALRA